MTSTSFGGPNSGLQIGHNHGTIEAQFPVTAEVYNTQGGAVFTGNLTANRDINIHNTATVRTCAHSLYKSLFSSSDLFTQVRNELGLLVSVLNVTEEYTPRFQPDDPKLSELNDARDKCHHALYELSQFKDHFDNVSPQTQVAWERSDWGGTELLDIRSKLTLYIQMLNALNSSISRSSIENVERMLKIIISDIRSGKRESAAMSSDSTGSLTVDERVGWRQLRKELQSTGITPEIFAQHRSFILDTLQTLFTENESEDCSIDFATSDVALEEMPSERLPEAIEGASRMAVGEALPASSAVTAANLEKENEKPGRMARVLHIITSLITNSGEKFESRHDSCEHKTSTGCQLAFTGLCCACADQRPISLYEIYVDGRGLIQTSKRSLHYCPSCKDYWRRHRMVDTRRVWRWW